MKKRATRVKMKKDLAHEALDVVSRKRDLRELRGKIGFRRDYDHKALRQGRKPKMSLQSVSEYDKFGQ